MGTHTVGLLCPALNPTFILGRRVSALLFSGLGEKLCTQEKKILSSMKTNGKKNKPLSLFQGEKQRGGSKLTQKPSAAPGQSIILMTVAKFHLWTKNTVIRQQCTW